MSTVLTPPQPPQIKVGKLTALRPRLSYLLFGDSGSGKTTTSVTAPKPILHVNIDNSVQSIFGEDGVDIYPAPGENGFARPVGSWEEFMHLLDWIETEGYKHYKTFTFDSFTALGDPLLKDYILKTQGPTGRVHPRVMSISDYGVYGDLLLDALRRVADLPANVVVTAQPEDTLIDSDNPDGGSVLIRRASFGRGKMVPENAPAKFDVIGYIQVGLDEQGELVRSMVVQPVNNKRSKLRAPKGVKLPPILAEPDLTKLLERLTNVSEKQN